MAHYSRYCNYSNKCVLGVLMSAFACAVAWPVVVQAAPSDYAVLDKQHLDGITRWDYLSYETASKRLYITHGDEVDIVDTANNKLVGHIPNVHGVHGVALAPELNRGFTSNGKDNTVTIFSLSTSKVIGTVPTEKKPDAIVYDPISRRVFAANGDSDSVTAIDAVGAHTLGAVALGGKPEFSTVDGKGNLFVNLENKNSVVVINTTTLAITRRDDLSSVCNEPAGLSMDTARQVLFVGCHNQTMAIVDAANGAIIDSLPIGRGSDATAFDAQAQRAFSSNGDGTLSVIGRSISGRYTVLQTVATMPSARTMAVDPVTHRVYLVAAEIDHVNAPTPQTPRPRAQLKTDTFTLITVAPHEYINPS